MSLDGFIAGPNDGPALPLGERGERLHEWVFNGETPSDHNEMFKPVGSSRAVFDEAIETSGAVVVGRRMFDNAQGWGGSYPFPVPVFVLSHDVPDEVAPGFSFVTDGIESALEQAKAAAGDKDVHIGGGANTVQQYMRAGLLDEIQIHVVALLLGDGIRLFDEVDTGQMELERTRVIESPGVTHFRFRVVKRGN